MSASNRNRQPWQSGKVRWFDELKGEGLIRSIDGRSYYVHYSAIQSDKRRKSLRPGDEVEFQLLEESHFIQVDKVREV